MAAKFYLYRLLDSNICDLWVDSISQYNFIKTNTCTEYGNYLACTEYGNYWMRRVRQIYHMY